MSAVASAPGDVGPSAGSTWRTRLLAHNWVVELAILAILVVAYNFVRAMPQTTEAVALLHARHILALEGFVFEAVEVPLNTWLTGVPVIAVAACYFYALMHYAATPVVLFLSRHRDRRTYWRGYWTLMLASGTALVIYALYPVAPPRLVPGLDIVDVMRRFADYGWWGAAASAPRGIGDATNQFAAMPSMHFGWALWCAIQMWGFGGVIWRVLAGLYPSLLVVVVVATGNHFLLDIAGGAACVMAAYAVVALIGARTPQHPVPPDASPRTSADDLVPVSAGSRQ